MEKSDAALAFLHRVASCYRPRGSDQDIILEACFTDIHKSFQLVLGRESCAVLTEGFRPFTARAEAAYPVFEEILRGKKSPALAILRGRVKVTGDLRVLKEIEDFFPGLKVGE
jgi:putative sterol carrier protein